MKRSSYYKFDSFWTQGELILKIYEISKTNSVISALRCAQKFYLNVLYLSWNFWNINPASTCENLEEKEAKWNFSNFFWYFSPIWAVQIFLGRILKLRLHSSFLNIHRFFQSSLTGKQSWDSIMKSRKFHNWRVFYL